MTDEELDRQVAEKIMGWKPRKPTHGPCCTCQDCGWEKDGCLCYFSPSTDISDAMRVAEKIQEKYRTVQINLVRRRNPSVIICDGFDPTNCSFTGESWSDDDAGEGFEVYEDTLPRAICLAALKAVEEEDK